MKVFIRKDYYTFNSFFAITIVFLVTNMLFGASNNPVNEHTSLRSAVSQNQIETVKTLIANGVNVNEVIKDAEEPTALMLAARYAHIEIMKLLIDNAANVNVKAYDGYTALLWMAGKKYPKIVKLLIEHGADVNAKSDDGHTPLTSAQSINGIENMKLLIEHGADVNVKSPIGYTVLDWEAMNGHTEIVKLLIQHGAEVNAKSEQGYTALMSASSHGYIEIMELLIEHGADVNAKTDHGYTALIEAVKHGQSAAVKILIQNHVNKESIQSALATAARLYYQDIVDLLLKHGADPQVLINIPNPPFNPLRGFVQTVFGSHHNIGLEAFSGYSLLLLGLISLVRLFKKYGSLLWDTLIPLIAILLYFLYEAVKIKDPMISLDHIIFPILFAVIGISSLSGYIKVLISK